MASISLNNKEGETDLEKNLAIQSNGLTLAATLHDPSNQQHFINGRGPLVIICHGFVGNRIGEHRLFVHAARELSSLGFFVLRFDYGGCGESSGDYGEGGLDSLIRQTGDVLNYAETIHSVDCDRITLLGHSLGGAVALLTAARDSRIQRLILWSAVAFPFTDIVRIVGKRAYGQSRFQPVDYLGYPFSYGYFHSLSAFHPLQEAQQFKGDVLIAHGDEDDVIPVDYSFLYKEQFEKRKMGQSEHKTIYGANHTFLSRESRDQLFHITKEWLLDEKKKTTQSA